MSDTPRRQSKLAPGAKLVIALIFAMFLSVVALAITGAIALIIRLLHWAMLLSC